MDRDIIFAAAAVSLLFSLAMIPFPRGSEDLGITRYENATLISAVFEKAHWDSHGVGHDYVPDSWMTKVSIGGREYSSDCRAVYENVTRQNSTEKIAVKVAVKKAYYKATLFKEYWEYEYTLVV